jgi:phosphonoacetaldehyde hydrolase
MGVSDIDPNYKTFIPLQIERVGAHSQSIPAALESLTMALERGLRIGSTTGYPRAVMQRLTKLARALGYEPDCVVCADDLTAGARPSDTRFTGRWRSSGHRHHWRAQISEGRRP